ncbi:response regulator [Motiliproteus sp. MSK22-1]|uniref:response regulator n=1 Tax=Motiliproteus sp. MSK22-1 TaxID=1897630 RepID=UPI000976A6A8|nr:response regulator [Motiliproteus sp. MSK22-1]OMH39565.1 two-component system response regulator [Motiliproteus sp. MSK22-1]
MANLKILVVDDAAFIRDMVRKTLRARFPGFSVEEAINGRKAQQLLSKENFDLILCDWEMPEMSGIELLAWLRKEHKQATPFVMVTSRGDKANVVEAVQAGVTDYIGKPFSREKLLNKVIKVLNKKHDLKAAESDSSGAQASVAAGSIDALTAKRAAPAKKPAPAVTSPLITEKPAPAPKPSSAKPSGRGTAHLRFGDAVCECIVKALSLKQISLVCRTQDGIPSILEPVVVDLQQSDSSAEIARINAYVHQLQAAEPSMDSALVNVSVTIVDQDPNKLSYLSKMIARGTSSSGYVPGA